MQQFFKTKQSDTGLQVWDPVRKKYVALTPEEEVRHRILSYLVEQCKYPLSLISVEKQLMVFGRKRRYDIVVYNRQSKPCLLVECKQENVAMTQTVMEQIARYNLALEVPFLLITNGLQHFILQINQQEKTFEWKNELPSFEDLNAF